MNDTYRNSVPTTSVLTITSNVVYGKETGSTPMAARLASRSPPGANPMHKRDSHGAIASLSSVSKLPFRMLDGISNTFSIIPECARQGGSCVLWRYLTLISWASNYC